MSASETSPTDDQVRALLAEYELPSKKRFSTWYRKYKVVPYRGYFRVIQWVAWFPFYWWEHPDFPIFESPEEALEFLNQRRINRWMNKQMETEI